MLVSGSGAGDGGKQGMVWNGSGSVNSRGRSDSGGNGVWRASFGVLFGGCGEAEKVGRLRVGGGDGGASDCI